jgi:hypothetical protein
VNFSQVLIDLNWSKKFNDKFSFGLSAVIATNGAGLMDNFGSQTKPCQGARVAEAVVVCIELALCPQLTAH